MYNALAMTARSEKQPAVPLVAFDECYNSAAALVNI